MKKNLLAAMALFALLLNAYAQDIIKNGNFENQLEGWTVPGWIKNAATPELDASEMPGAGHASLKLVGGDGKLPIIFQTITFQPGVAKYTVSFQMKTENMNNWGWVMLHISSNKTNKRYFQKVVGAGVGKDNSRPWAKYEGTLELPPEAIGSKGTLTIQFGGKTTGTVWVDDISVTPDAATPTEPPKEAPAAPKPAASKPAAQSDSKAASEVKKKLDLTLKEAADTDLFLRKAFWSYTGWVPNVFIHTPADED